MIKHFMFNAQVQRQTYDFGFTNGKLEQLFTCTPGRGVTIIEQQYRNPNDSQSEIDVATFIEAIKAAIYDKNATQYFDSFLEELSKDDKYFSTALAVITDELNFLSFQTHNLAKIIHFHISNN